jgi:hypothetical protein
MIIQTKNALLVLRTILYLTEKIVYHVKTRLTLTRLLKHASTVHLDFNLIIVKKYVDK